jgi:hypothetical protein
MRHVVEHKHTMTDANAELLRTFLADETKAFPERRQGKFWPLNHHWISPLVTRAHKLLDEDERTDLYFHFMRVTGNVPAVSEKEMPLLLDAYGRLLPVMDIGGIIQMARRHEFLFVFGFDDTGVLASGKTSAAEALKLRRKLIRQVTIYTNLPGQLKSKVKFVSFADEAVRILETLRHLAYRHDRRYGDDLYDVVNLSFWGMVFTGLLNKSTRADLTADMLEGKYDLARRDEQIAILNRFVEAVLPDVEPEEERFRSLASQLKERATGQHNAT